MCLLPRFFFSQGKSHLRLCGVIQLQSAWGSPFVFADLHGVSVVLPVVRTSWSSPGSTPRTALPLLGPHILPTATAGAHSHGYRSLLITAFRLAARKGQAQQSRYRRCRKSHCACSHSQRPSAASAAESSLASAYSCCASALITVVELELTEVEAW
jgi:hypothetical protein